MWRPEAWRDDRTGEYAYAVNPNIKKAASYSFETMHGKPGVTWWRQEASVCLISAIDFQVGSP